MSDSKPTIAECDDFLRDRRAPVDNMTRDAWASRLVRYLYDTLKADAERVALRDGEVLATIPLPAGVPVVHEVLAYGVGCPWGAAGPGWSARTVLDPGVPQPDMSQPNTVLKVIVVRPPR